MSRFRPTMYKNSVFSINYDKLKRRGIKCLIFDIDNTIATLDEEKPLNEVRDFLQKLKKNFQVILLSNNFESRVKKVAEELDADYVSFALKPSRRGLRYVSKQWKFKKNEMVIIGDQLLTDILAGNRYGIMTILIDPLAKKDLRITSFNRKIEELIFKVNKKDKFERGNYYE